MLDIRAALEARREQSLYRKRRITTSPQGAEVVIDDTRLVNFASNDYLGLANHPQVVKAFKDGADRYGVGSGAAHLIVGHSEAHHALEEELAEATGRERALLFSTGYMANIGVITALIGRKGVVFEDRLNHASLIDGGLFSGARFKRYPHVDVDKLRSDLEASDEGDKLVVTDGVFSMDGDIAPLDDMSNTCKQNDAWLMVDDAHGFGVLGERGEGSPALFGLNQEDIPIYMATLGKGIGTFGAFVAGSEDLIEFLIQEARTYVYTTALPPAVAEATRASLKISQQENWRREKLRDLIARFRKGAEQLGLSLMPSQTPIQPLIIGSSSQCLRLGDALRECGFYVGTVRPPTVPKDSARMRIALNCEHEEAHIDGLLEALDRIR